MGSSCSCTASKSAFLPDNDDCIETVNSDGQIRVYRHSNRKHTINNNRPRRHSSVF